MCVVNIHYSKPSVKYPHWKWPTIKAKHSSFISRWTASSTQATLEAIALCVCRKYSVKIIDGYLSVFKATYTHKQQSLIMDNGFGWSVKYCSRFLSHSTFPVHSLSVSLSRSSCGACECLWIRHYWRWSGWERKGWKLFHILWVNKNRVSKHEKKLWYMNMLDGCSCKSLLENRFF